MTSLVAHMLEDDNYVPLTVSTHYVAKEHTAEGMFLGIQETLDRLGLWVKRLKSYVEEYFPMYAHDIPDAEDINMAKFIKGRANMCHCAT